MYLNGSFFDRCSVQIIPNWKFVGVILNILQARLPKENIETSKGQTLQKTKTNDPSPPPGRRRASTLSNVPLATRKHHSFKWRSDHSPNLSTTTFIKWFNMRYIMYTSFSLNTQRSSCSEYVPSYPIWHISLCLLNKITISPYKRVTTELPLSSVLV